MEASSLFFSAEALILVETKFVIRSIRSRERERETETEKGKKKQLFRVLIINDQKIELDLLILTKIKILNFISLRVSQVDWSHMKYSKLQS